jgi:hypothetical protein
LRLKLALALSKNYYINDLNHYCFDCGSITRARLVGGFIVAERPCGYLFIPQEPIVCDYCGQINDVVAFRTDQMGKQISIAVDRFMRVDD